MFKWDIRLPNIDACSYIRQRQEYGGVIMNRGPLHNRDNTRSSPHLSMVALGCFR